MESFVSPLQSQQQRRRPRNPVELLMVNINNLYNRYYGGNYSHNGHLPPHHWLRAARTVSPLDSLNCCSSSALEIMVQ